jgi:ankyrin repeat protein
MHRNFLIYFILLLALNLFGADKRQKSYCKKLHNAVKENNYLNVKKALKKTKINCKDEMGRTALHVFAEKGKSEEIFKILYARGAKPAFKTRDGSTPLMVAAASQNLFAITMIFRYYGQEHRINEQNNAGQTALHIAALTENLTIIKRLLLVGADQTTRDKNCKLPRDLAHIIQANEVIRMLADEEQWIGISLCD